MLSCFILFIVFAFIGYFLGRLLGDKNEAESYAISLGFIGCLVGGIIVNVWIERCAPRTVHEIDRQEIILLSDTIDTVRSGKYVTSVFSYGIKTEDGIKAEYVSLRYFPHGKP